MWSRKALKDRAKAFLKGNYWRAFVISLVIFLVSGSGGGGGRSGVSTDGVQFDSTTVADSVGNFFSVIPVWHLAIGVGIVTILVLAALAFKVFVAYPFQVGGDRFFLKGAESEDTSWGHLTFVFRSEQYLHIVVTMLYRGLLNFFFYLLLIIPGIIKSYAYAMVPYILSDNPEIDRRRAIELSEAMTMGQKWEMFVLDVSFIGWYILGSLLFGIGVVFVNPYVDATKAQLYIELRRMAIENHVTSYQELNVQGVSMASDDSWYEYE